MKNRNILVITSWSFRDALIQAYTLPYIKLIRDIIPPASLIYLVTLEQENLKIEENNKIRIKEELRKQGIIWLDFHFSNFGIRAILERFIQLIKLYYICIRRKINYIHAWCTPAGVIGYLLSVLTGKKLILDSFEPHAEPSVETGTWKKNSFAFRILFYFEKKQAKRAKFVIAASGFIIPYSKEKWNIDLQNVFVKPALVDLEKFNYELKKNPDLEKLYELENKIVCVYAGKVGGIYLDDEIFDFIKVCNDYWGDMFRFFMITNAPRERIEGFCFKAGLDKNIVISNFIDHKEIPRYIALGDFAINPVKMVKSKRCCTSIKDGEYWALGLPVVITDSVAEDVKIILENDAGAILKELNRIKYLEAVKKIDSMLKKYSQRELYDKIRPLAEKYRNYNIAKEIYNTIYNNSGFSDN